MSAENLRLADEFVAMVGAENLLSYLGLPEDASADAAVQALRERRRYMQGMQSNPKYKKQALFLIKHLSVFEELLSDPPSYLSDVAERKEQERLPVLESTMRGVLRGGRLTQPQVEYLQEQAEEQGIRRETFEPLLQKLCAEHGLPDPFSNAPQVDHYAILGVSPDSDHNQIYEAYRHTHREARNTPEPAASRSMKDAADNAWRVLGNEDSRRAYDLSRQATAPPAAPRSMGRPHHAHTAPPIRTNPQDASAQPQRLEIIGSPIRKIRVGNSPGTDTIRLRTASPMSGFVTSTAPAWLKVEPAHLMATAQEQTITVTVHPDFHNEEASAGVHIVTEYGDRAQIAYEVERRRISPLTFALAFGSGVLLLVAAFLWFYGPNEAATRKAGLQISIDPTADEVQINGKSYGGGTSVYVPDPPRGRVNVRVTQRNFETWEDIVQVAGEGVTEKRISLNLAEPMDFIPQEGMTQGPLNADRMHEVMGPRSRSMDLCLRDGLEAGQTIKGQLRIHIRRSGRAQGIEMTGDRTDEAAVRNCLLRQAAAIYIHPLDDGDYATVRYDYEISL